MGNYVSGSLTNGESIVLEAQISRKAVNLSLGVTIVLAVLFIFNSVLVGMGNTAAIGMTVFTALMAPIFAIVTFRLFLMRKSTELGLTTKRLIGKTGILKINTMDAPLDKIQNVSTSYGIIDRILGYGKVQINTAAGVFVFPFVDAPENYKSKVMNQIEYYKEEKIRKDVEAMSRTMAQNNSNSGEGCFCPKCGTRNPSDTFYCKKCGNKIN